MPKVIENLELRLSEEARRQVEENGYAALTIRSVARACGVGVGTVYNYYPSKESLAASYMLRDWNACYTNLLGQCQGAGESEAVVQSIYEMLLQFRADHAALFHDDSAKGSFSTFSSLYHSRLREELAKPLRPLCADDFTSVFVAESLLAWSAETSDFGKLYKVLSKIIEQKE